jgi:hypothetical protein
MFLAQDIQDEMLDSPPFFTALRDVSRLFSPEYQDMVRQSTTAASTTNFPHLPMLKQIPSSGTVEMAENGLVSRPLCSQLAASHSASGTVEMAENGLVSRSLCSQLAASHSGWRSFKDVFHISFSADTSPNTSLLQHTPHHTKSTFNTVEFCRPPLPLPQARQVYYSSPVFYVIDFYIWKGLMNLAKLNITRLEMLKCTGSAQVKRAKYL